MPKIFKSVVSINDSSSHSFLIASMGLQVLWSFGLACLDIYALRKKRDLQNPVIVSLFVVGDWVSSQPMFCFMLILHVELYGRCCEDDLKD